MITKEEVKAAITALAVANEEGAITPEYLGNVLDKLQQYAEEGLSSFVKSFEVITSISELPESPTDAEKTVAYVLGAKCYVYVGEGGDTASGKYQSIGFGTPTDAQAKEAVDEYMDEHPIEVVDATEVATEEGISDEKNVQSDLTQLSLGQIDITEKLTPLAEENLTKTTTLLTATDTNIGYALNADGTLYESTSYCVSTYDVQNLSTVFITGRQPGVAQLAIAVALDAQGNATPYKLDSNNYIDHEITLPSGTMTLKVMGYLASSTSAQYSPMCKKYVYSAKQYYEDGTLSVTSEDTESLETSIASTTSGYISAQQTIGSAIAITTGSAKGYKVFSIPANSVVNVIFSETTGAYGFALTDTDDNVLEYTSNYKLTEYTFASQNVATKLWVSNNKFDSATRKTTTILTGKEAIEKALNGISYWQGKKIWWCGTSIPAGGDVTLGSDESVAGKYPTQVGINLGATVYNVAEGGSMCRANVRTGDYDGAVFANITSALAMTTAEVEDFISNYSTIKSKLASGAPDSLSATYLARLREASFEAKLLPYLNGIKSMPDLFVIDHGHNDYKYKLSDGSSDIALQPTRENITNGILAEDTYMTDNDYANLKTYLGDLSNIPSSSLDAFVCSLNRNCYIGAVNFIVTLILRYNPHARICFISNYEYQNGVNSGYSVLIPAQQSLANSWAFPLCEVYKYLGYSNHIIPNSMEWFNNAYPDVTPATTDVTVFRAYCADNTHPHTDISGDANKIYAGIVSEFLKKCR